MKLCKQFFGLILALSLTLSPLQASEKIVVLERVEVDNSVEFLTCIPDIWVEEQNDKDFFKCFPSFQGTLLFSFKELDLHPNARRFGAFGTGAGVIVTSAAMALFSGGKIASIIGGKKGSKITASVLVYLGALFGAEYTESFNASYLWENAEIADQIRIKTDSTIREGSIEIRQIDTEHTKRLNNSLDRLFEFDNIDDANKFLYRVADILEIEDSYREVNHLNLLKQGSKSFPVELSISKQVGGK